MTRQIFGFTTQVKCQTVHCVTHVKMLINQKMSLEVSVLHDVIISHTEVHSLNSHLFTQLCEVMDAQYTHLLTQKSNITF